MTTVWLALVLSTLAALADTLGGALTVVRRLTANQIATFTAIGAGFLLGATVLDRLPSTTQSLPKSGATFILVGYLMVLCLQVIRQQREGPALHNTTHDHSGFLTGGGIALASMLVHTFMDGVVIAGAIEMNRASGILMFVAVSIHKIPEGLTISSISLASSSSRRRALVWSFLLTCSTVVGAIVTLLLGELQGPTVNIVMALATGTFLFISTSDLVPYVRTGRQPKGLLLLVLGCVVFYMTLRIVESVGLS